MEFADFRIIRWYKIIRWYNNMSFSYTRWQHLHCCSGKTYSPWYFCFDRHSIFEQQLFFFLFFFGSAIFTDWWCKALSKLGWWIMNYRLPILLNQSNYAWTIKVFYFYEKGEDIIKNILFRKQPKSQTWKESFKQNAIHTIFKVVLVV